MFFLLVRLFVLGMWVVGVWKETYLVQRTGDGVTLWVTDGRVDLGGGEASEDGDDGSLGVHGVCLEFSWLCG